MFEDRYRELYKKITPPAALEQETLALMAEARDHQAKEPESIPHRHRVYAALIASAAVLAVTVTVTAFVLHGRLPAKEDDVGIFPGLSSGAASKGQLISGSSDQADSATSGDSTANGQTGSAGSKAQGGDSTAGSSNPGSTENGATAVNNGSGSGSTGSSSESTGASAADPRVPAIINNSTTRTYLSISDYLTLLDNKTAPGYGKSYYNTRQLMIVPASLPNKAHFIQFQLSPKTGAYCYSYWINYAGADYLLQVDAQVLLPGTLREVTLQLEQAKSEAVTMEEQGNRRTYSFGDKDKVLVTLTKIGDDTPPDMALTQAILEKFSLERCTPGNTLVNLFYVQ